MMSVIGRKNAGKTTLVVALAQEYARRSRKVATIKHGHHPTALDHEGKDTWRHYHEGKAYQTLIESPGERALFERTDEEAGPLDLARQYMRNADVVIVEGFSQHEIPKIEVFRTSEHSSPIFDEAKHDPSLWIAMLVDDRSLRFPFPVFCFTDTSWFNNLAHIAWNRALVLDAE